MIHRLPSQAARLLAALMLMCAVCCAPASAAPAPSSFQSMPVFGVDCLPAFSSGQLSYTLTLSPGAYLVYQDTHYPIAQIWGLYAVNNTGLSANDFVALGAKDGEWKWDQKSDKGSALSVAGWLDSPKKEALTASTTGTASKTFAYEQFAFTGEAPALGMHVTVALPADKPSPFGSGLTGGIIPNVVPEPSALIAALTGMAGLFGLIRRRRS